ncbi:MAG: SpoIIE family protein phosphatase [Bacteroidetes bacterium]|nr:SpoIIE family protein phosphatase [Bacteroidota bacterium]
MKPLQDRISPRSIRALYLIFAFAVLIVTGYNALHVMLWRVPSNDQCEWQQVFSDSTVVLIDMIKPASSMKKAGLLPGDILMAVDGTPVSRAKHAIDVMGKTTPGKPVRLRIQRDLREMDVFWTPRSEESGLPAYIYDRIFLMLVIRNIVPGGVTDRAGVQNGDILLRIDDVSINHIYGPSYLINVHAAGSKARFLVDRGGKQHTFHVTLLKTFNMIYLSEFLLGLGFLLVSLFVVLARPEGSIQRKFARYGIYALFFFGMSSITVSVPYDPAWKIYMLVAFGMLSRVIVPPVFVTYFMHFPVRRESAAKRWVIALLYGGSFLTAAILVATIFQLWGFMAPRWLYLTCALFPFAYFLGGLAIFTHSYFTRIDRTRRRQLRPILQSALIGIAVFVYLPILTMTHPLALFLDPYLLLPAILVVGIPPAFGYAIIRHRLMDVTLIVRRSIIYAIITASLAAIYLGVVFGLGSLLGYALGEADNTVLLMIAVIVIALIFDPLKRRIQSIVDRVFYQERYNYQKALLEFSSELPRQMNLEQILHSVVNRIATTMHVDKVSVALCDEQEGCHVLARNMDDALSVFDHRPGGVVELLKSARSPLNLALLDEDPRVSDEGDRSKIKESGVVLMVPMFIQDRLIGSINVGPKLSGKVYSQEDIDLLSTVASQAAIAIENARLHRSEIEKQKITEQLNIAQRIQQGLLPKENPRNPRLDISGISIPAQTVGGDYYDYIELPDNRLLVAVGDVSGKGMSAALYMSKVQGMIRFAAQMYDTPREILMKVNRLIYEGMERNSFITMILVLFDFNAETVTICRAGHTQPLIALNGDMGFVGSEGMGLGLEPGDVFDQALEEKVFLLKSHGLIVLYSDGLTEAMDQKKAEFGEDRVFAMVKGAAQMSASDLQELLISEVARHRGTAEQNDDITLVVIRIL